MSEIEKCRINVDIKRVEKYVDMLTETINSNENLNDDYVAGYQRGMRTVLQYIQEISQD